MKYLLMILLSACSTIHFRSNNTAPVTFSGNPKHQKPVEIILERDFYFWGVEPEHHTIFLDEEIRKAGHQELSKLIIYEHKSPSDILIRFLTFGIYMPTTYTITGFAPGEPAEKEIIENHN
jgi:hypothetical protein